LSSCARCGNKLNFYSRAFDSDNVYFSGLHRNVPLNVKYPSNPYKGKFLCADCYKEVYANGPNSPVPKTFEKSENPMEKARDNPDSYSGMMQASAVLSESSSLKNCVDKYLILYEQASKGLKFDNLNKAINVMAEAGWRCINITSCNVLGEAASKGICMYALMEKTD